MGLSDLIAGGMDATAATELLLNVIWTLYLEVCSFSSSDLRSCTEPTGMVSSV